MDNFIQVENQNNMLRDKKSGGISYINNDKSSRAAKRLYKQRLKEQEQLKEDVALLKNEMSEIKSLLIKLIER